MEPSPTIGSGAPEPAVAGTSDVAAGVLCIDASGTVTAIDEGAAALLGIGGKPVGGPLAALAPASVVERARHAAAAGPAAGAAVELAVRGGQPLEYLVCGAGNGMALVLLRAPARLGGDERARLERELERAEARWRAVFAQQFQFTALLDPDGLVLDFSDQLGARSPAVARTEVVGRRLWETLWWRGMSEQQTRWPERLAEAARSTGPVCWDDAYTATDGERRLAAAAVTALRDRDGRVEAYVVQGLDVTDRRHAEAQRGALETRLRESQKLEAIGTLAGGIAHDFNNILGSMLGNVALARDALGADHPALGPLEQIRRAGRRARSLVRQILAFSRRQPHERVAQPLQPLVEETLALLRATFTGSATLEARLELSPLWVRCDATQIQQVVINLCTNAWQALNEGRGRIEVELKHADGEAVLAVRDDGIGMDEATRERVFEPFFTTKPVGVGTGLGLSVVHGIVAEHCGTITVGSAPGAGSEFVVRLPLVEPGADSRPSGESSLVPLGGGARVMYIDDDEMMLPMVERLLERGGFRVSVFQDPGAALAAFARDPDAYDVVVTDFNMPRTSGLEVARELVRLRPGLPVVISSGFVSEALVAESARIGVRHLLHKENTLEDLCEMVRTALDGD